MAPVLENGENRRPLRIIVPARNEARRIRKTLTAYCEYFRDLATVLVVANGCSDDTVSIINELRTRFTNLSVLVVEAGIGKGGAVRAGLTVGDEPYIAIADADGSTSAREIERLFDRCRNERAAGVIGSRWLRGATIARKQTIKRRIASRAFNAIVRMMFGLRFTDTQCGAKVFTRAAIDRVLERLELANFAFDVDLLWALDKMRYRVIEMPIAWDDVPENSQVRILRSGWSMFWSLVRLWVRHSPLRSFPFLDLLARSSVIPVRAGLKVLVIRSADVAPTFDGIVREFEKNGHETATFDVDGPLATLRFARWYLTSGHRTCDIIVDGTRGLLSSMIAFSAKPKFTATTLASLHIDDISDATSAIAQRCGYSAMLWRDEAGWKLTSLPSESTLLEPV